MYSICMHTLNGMWAETGAGLTVAVTLLQSGPAHSVNMVFDAVDKLSCPWQLIFCTGPIAGQRFVHT